MAKTKAVKPKRPLPDAITLQVTATKMPNNRMPGFYEQHAALGTDADPERYRLGVGLQGAALYIFTPFDDPLRGASPIYTVDIGALFQAIVEQLDVAYPEHP